jgi:Protein of unknown function (DUF3306)
MSRDEGFLARWSRRKRLAAARRRGAADVAIAPEARGAKPTGLRPGAAAGAESAAAIGPEGLPPIESLDAASDITSFLAPGVPAELTRRALRRAWTADPEIRDFIGLSENAWDFTAPGGVPGFGPLSADEAAGLLARATEPGDDAGAAAPTPQPAAALVADPDRPAAPAAAAPSAAKGDGGRALPDRPNESPTDAANQPERSGSAASRPLPPRRHGGALPT